MADILAYIMEQQRAGYGEPQIRAALLASGYTQVDVDRAFRDLAGKTPDDAIRGYAQEYARQGYSEADAFAQLTQQGYPAGAAKKALHDVFGAPATECHPSTAIFIILALIVGIGGTYLFLNDAPVTEQPVQITLAQSEVIADVLQVARTEGEDTAVQQCHERLAGVHREKCLAAVAAGTEDLALCRQITDADVHDGCMLYFLNTDFDEVCAGVKLAESKATCASVQNLRGSVTRR